MSQSDNSMSMNSLMEAIYGEHHQTQYLYDNQQQQQNYTQQLTQFMQSLINHLIELCMTQGSVDNAQRLLNPWLRDIKINYRNPKPSLQGFLKGYLRLLEQERNKINKYGQKKLRYLTQTVSKQIFTQIMRLSCDLKFESVNKINNQRSIQKRVNNTVLLKHSIDRIFVRDLAIAFRWMKKNYQQTIKKEEHFVTNIQNSIRKLDMICVKARNSRLWKAVTLWRMKNLQVCQQQTIIICTVTKKFFVSVLPDIVKIWQDRPSNWVSIIIEHLSILFRDIIQSSEGTWVQFIGNPNFHNNSLDYSAISSYRSSISQISSISIAEYLKNEQIKFDNNNKFLAIPIIIGEDQIGLVKISWQYQLPITVFNRTLRFVQSLKLVIQGFAKISTRLSFYRAEYENSSWHEELYTLCLREEALELKSLEMILEAANIKYLQIYHDKRSPNACIKYGKQSGTEIPQNIYKLIWQKIVVTKSFKLEREDKSYEISKLDEEGFCRYSLEEEQQSGVESRLKSTVLQCIVPLLTKNLGRIGCQKCNIKIKQLRPNPNPIDQLNSGKNSGASIQNLQEKKELKLTDNLKYIMGIRNSKNIQQVQQEVYNLVKASFSGCKVFFKMLFNVDDNKDIYAYKSGVTIKTIQLHKAVANENICRVEKNEQNRKLKQISKIMNQNPMFENSDIYLYENEKSKPMKIIPKKLGRKCLLLLSTFQDLPENQVLAVLDRLATELQTNSDVFVKCDLHNWAYDIATKNKPNNYFGSNPTIPELNQSISHLSLAQFARKLCSNLLFVKKLYVWRVFADHAIDLTPQPNQQKSKIKNFPSHLLSMQPIRSHYSANGANKILKQSLTYGQKLQEYLTYIPNFGNEEFKTTYAEAVCGDLDEIGEYTDSRYQQISNFLIHSGKMNKQDTQFLSIPIQSQTRNYILLLLLKTPTNQLPNTYFNYLTKNIQRNLTEHINNQQIGYKNKILQKFNNYRILKGGLLENRTQKIRKIINKFYAYRNFKYQQLQTLSNAVYKMQDGVQYRLKKGMFEVVKRYCLWVRGKYIGGCDVFEGRIKKVFFMAPLIQKCRKICSIRQGTNKLYTSLHNILNNQNIRSRSTPKTLLSLLTQHCHQQKTCKKICKANSTISIVSTLEQIINRNKTIYFRKGKQNELSLKRSLIILQQQFRLIDPKTIKTAVNFLQGRLNLMLSHCYASRICVKVYNFGFSGQADVDVGGKEGRLSFVRNSSFAFLVCMENDDDIQFEGLNNLVQNVLYEILPNWQLNHRKSQNFKLQTLTKLLQKHIHISLSHIFSIHNHMLINSQLAQNKQLKNKVEDQKQQMKNMKQNINPNINNQKREKHKKQIYELKQNISVIQNQLDRSCVEGKIKSKTNAGYRMLMIVGRRDGNGGRGQAERDFRGEIGDIKKSKRQDKQRYLHEVLPIWSASIKNLIKRAQMTNIQSSFHKLTRLQ